MPTLRSGAQPRPIPRQGGKARNRQEAAADPEQQQDMQTAEGGKQEREDHIDADPRGGAEERQHIRQERPEKMIEQDKQIAVHMLDKHDDENDRNQRDLLKIDADPEADNADQPINRALNAPVETQHARDFVERLRDGIAAQDTNQSKAGDRWKDHRGAGNEAVNSQRIKTDELRKKQRQRKLCRERESAQRHDRQRRQCAATPHGV